VETSRVSNRTAISWRRGYRITPKFIMGKPADVIGERLKWMPLGIRSWVSDRVLTLLIGKNKDYGLPEANERFGSTHPTINSELLYKIRHGKVHPRPFTSPTAARRILTSSSPARASSSLIRFLTKNFSTTAPVPSRCTAR